MNQSGLLLIQVAVTDIQDPTHSIDPGALPIANITQSATLIAKDNRIAVFSVIEKVSAFLSPDDLEQLLSHRELTESKLHKASFHLFYRDRWESVTLLKVIQTPILGTLFSRLMNKGHSVLADFAILELVYPNLSLRLPEPASVPLEIGQTVTVVSSPFGLLGVDLYHNSITTGIVSTVLDHEVVVLDVRSLPGSTGGTVMVANTAVGILVPSFAAISPFAVLYPFSYLAAETKLNPAYECVVRVESNSVSGSGVVWSDDIVVTNKHVVGNANRVVVRVNGEACHGDVIVTGKSLDLALIRVSSKISKAARRTRVVQAGERVFAVGFGNLGNGTSYRPIATAGTLCKCVTRDNVTVALQTSAYILDGQSGGGLFNTAGDLIGLVTSTVKVADIPLRLLGLCISVQAVETKSLWENREKWLEDIFSYQTVEQLPEFKGKL